MTKNKTAKMTGFFIVIFMALTTFTCPLYGELLRGGEGHSFFTEASFYTVASCIKESGQCIMANGKELQDEGRYTVASWDYKFGTLLRIKCGNREIVAVVSDRGPNKRLYKKGRKIDLNLSAAKALGIYPRGLGMVEIERVK